MAEEKNTNVGMAKIDDRPRSPNRSPAPPETQSSTSDSAYPPQRHAGAVGYGPEYGKGAGAVDKLQGFQEEIKGKVLRKPDLVQHGHDMRTGELKKKQLEADFNGDPFNTAGGDDDKKDDNSRDNKQQEQAATTAPEGTQEADAQRQGQNTDKTNYMGSN